MATKRKPYQKRHTGPETRGRAPKIITREMIVKAHALSKSNMAAARVLHVSYHHYRKYAKMYMNSDGISLFDEHKNQIGLGIPKFIKNSRKEPMLEDIVSGLIKPTSYPPDKLKYRLIEEGYLKEECSICGFNERRVIDYKVPLIMHFKDGNKANYNLDNIELLCYNHFFLTVGDIFTNREVKRIESHISNEKDITVKWELDDYHIQRLRELGLDNIDDELDKYISKI